MVALETKLQQAEQKNAELTARLEVRERINGALLNQLEGRNRELQEQAERLQRQLQEVEAKNRHYSELNTLLKEEIAWFKSQVYGRSSEKSSGEVSPDQDMLFNEPEVLTAIAAAIGSEADAVITIEEHARQKKPGKKAIPADFPRIPVIYDIAESEKICAHDGAALQVIGRETAERYDYVAPQLRVLVDTRLKYACPCCHEGVKIAPLPPRLLPKSMATPSLLAHITTAKFVDGLPLTRQSKQFERLDVNLGAGTMGLWINTIGTEKLPPLIALMHEAILAEPVLHSDETTVQVLKSQKAATSDHYMIVRAAGPPGRRIVLFNYAPTRNVDTLKQILTGPDGPYRGKLVCDGLELYDYVGEDPAFAGMTLFGCLTHCRRYYDKAAKVTESPSGQQLARVALKDFLGKVFFIERQIDEQRQARERAGGQWSLADTLKIRQERSAPIMTAFKAWVDELAPGVPSKSMLGKALGYTISQWEKLRRFLEHPDVPAHNNRVENDIRPFAVGRRAWLFLDTQRGAYASANIYSLASTCRANGINALAYFTYLYEQLPKATTAEDLEALLPWNVKPLLKAAPST
ncbi:MAG: IS66 family transposase [Gammaproteobacteria bacterium]